MPITEVCPIGSTYYPHADVCWSTLRSHRNRVDAESECQSDGASGLMCLHTEERFEDAVTIAKSTYPHTSKFISFMWPRG